MKIFARLAAVVAAIMLLSGCSVLKTLTANALATGTNTGSALLNLYNVYKTAKSAKQGIDLTNTSNLLNLGQLLTGASSLTNATPTYTNQFSNGLISGSSNLVNNSNLANVLSGLMSLGNINSPAITQAATQAATGTQATVTASQPGVSETISALTGLLGLLGK